MVVSHRPRNLHKGLLSETNVLKGQSHYPTNVRKPQYHQLTVKLTTRITY